MHWNVIGFTNRWAMAAELQVCRGCGCTDDAACLDEMTGTGCHWVAPGLCSECVGLVDPTSEQAPLLFDAHGRPLVSR